jgi:hypothetical protein
MGDIHGGFASFVTPNSTRCPQRPRTYDYPSGPVTICHRQVSGLLNGPVSRCWDAEQPWHAALERERVQGAMHGRGQGRHRDGPLDATSEGMHSATGGSAGCAGPAATSRRSPQSFQSRRWVRRDEELPASTWYRPGMSCTSSPGRRCQAGRPGAGGC